VTRSSTTSRTPKNHILLHLPEQERKYLVDVADRVVLPARSTVARPGDLISSTYFPDDGVLSIVSEMTTGHQVAVAAVGVEGVVGVGPLFGAVHHPDLIVVLLESEGYRVPTSEFRDLFERSEALRRTTLAHIGRRLSEVTIVAGCNRVHSHRRRLARWLLVITDRAGQQSLRVTHEMLAQMVGGPRHAVTVALQGLRERGAIGHVRGRIQIVNREALVAQACECYGHPRLTSP